MQFGINLYGDHTVYVFVDTQLHDTMIAGGKHLRYFTCGFTLDSTGTNLPSNIEWKYLKELQPGEIFEFPLVEYIDTPERIEPITHGLKEKGWYVGQIFYGYRNMSIEDIKGKAAALRREYHRVSGEKLSETAEELLADLLKEPKAR